jgi:hypothetical protein
MRTNQVKNSQMNHHTSLENQQANAKQNDFIRCMASLDLYGFKLVGIRREDSVILTQSGDWTVEVDQDGLVKNQGSDKSPADFATWQFHNFSRLVGADEE